MKIGIILTPDIRSKAYLQKCIKNNLQFESVIFMNDQRLEKEIDKNLIELSKQYDFDISESVSTTLENNSISNIEFPFVDINNQKLIDYLKNLEIDYMIFTGGGILKKEILSSGIKFIHLHPGIVPDYRGSTCFYYSILNENYAGVTSFIMNESLDTGDIIFQKRFEKPNHEYLDEIFDPHIRSETLIELMKNKSMLEEKIKQNKNSGETYFIIHPVLKHIAILKCIND
tara:strand:- start:6875 stop:7561 length:687 start_codon:yes stop_codon:yes gene_type:complete